MRNSMSGERVDYAQRRQALHFGARSIQELWQLSELIRSVVERFNRMNDVDISISSDDISSEDRFHLLNIS